MNFFHTSCYFIGTVETGLPIQTHDMVIDTSVYGSFGLVFHR